MRKLNFLSLLAYKLATMALVGAHGALVVSQTLEADRGVTLFTLFATLVVATVLLVVAHGCGCGLCRACKRRSVAHASVQTEPLDNLILQGNLTPFAQVWHKQRLQQQTFRLCRYGKVLHLTPTCKSLRTAAHATEGFKVCQVCLSNHEFLCVAFNQARHPCL